MTSTAMQQTVAAAVATLIQQTKEITHSTGAMNCSKSCDENVAGTLSIQIIALRGDSPLEFIT